MSPPAATTTTSPATTAPAAAPNSTVPAPPLQTDAPAADFGTLSDVAKQQWLDVHEFSKDYPTVSLGKAYNRGVIITHSLGWVDYFARTIAQRLVAAPETKTRKFGLAFLAAFDKGIFQFDNDLTNNLDTIWSTGALPIGGIVLQPLKLPQTPLLGASGQILVSPTDSAGQFKSVWDVVADFLNVLCSENPWLNETKPFVTASYAQLITSFVGAAKEFLDEWNAHPEALNAVTPTEDDTKNLKPHRANKIHHTV